MDPGKVIDIRGRKLGGDTPLICTPLVGRTRERVLAEAASVAAKHPDVVEWRVDYFEGIGDTKAVLDTGRALRTAVGDAPIIFTRRSIKEGGETIAIDDEAVVRLYDAVGASGLVDFLDFEMSNDAGQLQRVRDSAHKHGTRIILSYHNFGYTPGIDFLVAALPGSRAAGRRRGQGRGDAARPRRTCCRCSRRRRRRTPRRAFR